MNNNQLYVNGKNNLTLSEISEQVSLAIEQGRERERRRMNENPFEKQKCDTILPPILRRQINDDTIDEVNKIDKKITDAELYPTTTPPIFTAAKHQLRVKNVHPDAVDATPTLGRYPYEGPFEGFDYNINETETASPLPIERSYHSGWCGNEYNQSQMPAFNPRLPDFSDKSETPNITKEMIYDTMSVLLTRLKLHGDKNPYPLECAQKILNRWHEFDLVPRDLSRVTLTRGSNLPDFHGIRPMCLETEFGQYDDYLDIDDEIDPDGRWAEMSYNSSDNQEETKEQMMDVVELPVLHENCHYNCTHESHNQYNYENEKEEGEEEEDEMEDDYEQHDGREFNQEEYERCLYG